MSQEQGPLVFTPSAGAGRRLERTTCIAARHRRPRGRHTHVGISKPTLSVIHARNHFHSEDNRRPEHRSPAAGIGETPGFDLIRAQRLSFIYYYFMTYLAHAISSRMYSMVYRWCRSCLHGEGGNDIPSLLRQNLDAKNVFVIQIGSNDGCTHDPIFRLMQENPSYRGLFVEPVPYLFEKLQRNYGWREGLLFENAAINDGSTQPFYWVDPDARQEIPELPDWFDQLGSFNERHIRGVPGIADILLRYRRVTDVKGMSMQELLDRHGITRFDVLHIDTEGYDWQVLRQVDFARYTPRVVLYEHKCLSAEEKACAAAYVAPFYTTRDMGGDMFCVRKPSDA